jgi:peptide/nickel transport system permease protein
MWIYIVRRGVLVVPVIIGVMTITFAVTSALPVQDQLTAHFGFPKNGWHPYVSCNSIGINQTGQCPNPQYWNAYDALGLNRPIVVQWAIYMANSLTLNWGTTDAHSSATTSLGLTGQSVPVVTVLSWYLPYTLELAALSLIIILLIAIPLGNYSAVYRNRPLDQGTRVMSFSGFALPTFLLAFLVLFGLVAISGGSSVTFCNGEMDVYQLWTNSWPPPQCFTGGIYPTFIGPNLQTTPTHFPTIDAAVAGYWLLSVETVQRMIFPALVIAFASIAGILRFVRNSMLEVMNLDFVRTARSKGVPESVVISRHAGRNSLNVTITVLGLTFAGFLVGFPIIEEVYSLQGIGRTLVFSIQAPYDFGLIFGTTLLFTLIVVSANLIVDVLYAYLDPRVRLG